MRLLIGQAQTPANPLLRAVSLIVGAILFLAALFFGAVLLAFIIGFAVILAAIAMVRIWWISRKIERGSGNVRLDLRVGPSRFGRKQSGESAGKRIIEGEFIDVSESRAENERQASRDGSGRSESR